MLKLHRARRRDDADRPEAGGAKTHGGPYFTHETRNRCLAAGAGDGDDQIGLASEEMRRQPWRKPGAGWTPSPSRHPSAVTPSAARMADGPGSNRLWDEFCSVDGAIQASAANRNPGFTARLSEVRPRMRSAPAPSRHPRIRSKQPFKCDRHLASTLLLLSRASPASRDPLA